MKYLAKLFLQLVLKLSAASFFLVLVACGSDKATTPASTSTELTLANCTTSVANDVPEFYKKYFKCSTITISAGKVVIESDGLPPHKSAYYGVGHPNYTTFDTTAGKRQNPNTISTQTIHLEFPLTPVSRGLTINGTLVDGTQGNNANEFAMGIVGVGLDGVSIYNALAAPPDLIADEANTFDSYSAHADVGGTYHYHSTTPGPLEVMQSLGLTTSTTPESADIELYGIMCDGTVVMGCTELNGSAVGAAALDSQNGHVHDLMDAASVGLSNRYHVHVCPGSYAHDYTPEIQYYNSCVSN